MVGAQVAETPEVSSGHFHAAHIHTHRAGLDALPPYPKTPELPPIASAEPAVASPSSRSSLPPLLTDSQDSEGSEGSEAGGPPPTKGLDVSHRFGGGIPYGQRDIHCYARSLSEDFELYCKIGGLRRRQYKAATLGAPWRGCTALHRTQVGQWAGAKNGQHDWPGARAQSSVNEQQLAEVRSRRHEAISTGQVATRIPGLTHIKSTSLMLGHAANPRARQRPEQFT